MSQAPRTQGDEAQPSKWGPLRWKVGCAGVPRHQCLLAPCMSSAPLTGWPSSQSQAASRDNLLMGKAEGRWDPLATPGPGRADCSHQSCQGISWAQADRPRCLWLSRSPDPGSKPQRRLWKVGAEEGHAEGLCSVLGHSGVPNNHLAWGSGPPNGGPQPHYFPVSCVAQGGVFLEPWRSE